MGAVFLCSVDPSTSSILQHLKFASPKKFLHFSILRAGETNLNPSGTSSLNTTTTAPHSPALDTRPSSAITQPSYSPPASPLKKPLAVRLPQSSTSGHTVRGCFASGHARPAPPPVRELAWAGARWGGALWAAAALFAVTRKRATHAGTPRAADSAAARARSRCPPP